jgi:N utilization substance protein B
MMIWIARQTGTSAVTHTPPPIEPDILDYYNTLRERMNALPELMDGDDLALEIVEPKPDANDNSHARRVALQALYELEAAHHDLGGILSVHLAHLDDIPTARAFAHQIVLGVAARRSALDIVIGHFAPAVPVPQLALIDRTILRMALWELLAMPEQPIGAVIDEAVELATHFGAESSAAFINGVLGAVVEEAKSLRALRHDFNLTHTTTPSARAESQEDAQ